MIVIESGSEYNPSTYVFTSKSLSQALAYMMIQKIDGLGLSCRFQRR